MTSEHRYTLAVLRKALNFRPARFLGYVLLHSIMQARVQAAEVAVCWEGPLPAVLRWSYEKHDLARHVARVESLLRLSGLV